MSTAEFERFAADLMSNETLRAEAEKHTAAKECVAAFAAGKGYVFTTDELTACVMAKTKTAELSDAQLAGVAGGAAQGWVDPMPLPPWLVKSVMGSGPVIAAGPVVAGVLGVAGVDPGIVKKATGS